MKRFSISCLCVLLPVFLQLQALDPAAEADTVIEVEAPTHAHFQTACANRTLRKPETLHQKLRRHRLPRSAAYKAKCFKHVSEGNATQKKLLQELEELELMKERKMSLLKEAGGDMPPPKKPFRAVTSSAPESSVAEESDDENEETELALNIS